MNLVHQTQSNSGSGVIPCDVLCKSKVSGSRCRPIAPSGKRLMLKVECRHEQLIPPVLVRPGCFASAFARRGRKERILPWCHSLFNSSTQYTWLDKSASTENKTWFNVAGQSSSNGDGIVCARLWWSTTSHFEIASETLRQFWSQHIWLLYPQWSLQKLSTGPQISPPTYVNMHTAMQIAPLPYRTQQDEHNGKETSGRSKKTAYEVTCGAHKGTWIIATPPESFAILSFNFSFS